MSLLLLLQLVACDDAKPAPTCVDWLACYSVCTRSAVTDLDDQTLVDCDLMCRSDLNYLASENAVEAGPGSSGYGSFENVVAVERQAIADQLLANELESDPENYSCMPRADAAFWLSVSLEQRGECIASGD